MKETKYTESSIKVITAQVGLDRIPNQPYQKIPSVDPTAMITLAHQGREAGENISRLRARKRSLSANERELMKKECFLATAKKEELVEKLNTAYQDHIREFRDGVNKILSEKSIRDSLQSWDSIDAERFFHGDMSPGTVSRAYGLTSTLMMSADLGKNKGSAAAVAKSGYDFSPMSEYVHFFPEPWALNEGLLDVTQLGNLTYLRKKTQETIQRNGRITSPIYRLDGGPPRVAQNWQQLEEAQQIIGRALAQKRNHQGLDIICCDYIGDTIIEIHVPPIGLVGGYMASINPKESGSPIVLLENEFKKYFGERRFQRAVVIANEKYENLGLFRYEIERIADALKPYADVIQVERENINQDELNKYDLVFLYGNPLIARPNPHQEVINAKILMDFLDSKVKMLQFAKEVKEELQEIGIKIPTNYIVEGRNQLPKLMQKYLRAFPKNSDGIPDIQKVNDVSTKAILQGELMRMLRDNGISQKILIKSRVHRAVLETAHGSLTKPPFLDVSYLPMAMQALDIIVRNDGGIFEEQIELKDSFVERRLYSVVVRNY